MRTSRIFRLVTISGVLAMVSTQTPALCGFTSNRASHYSDGCARHINPKESEKAQRKREKAAVVNVQAREFAMAFRGHTR